MRPHVHFQYIRVDLYTGQPVLKIRVGSLQIETVVDTGQSGDGALDAVGGNEDTGLNAQTSPRGIDQGQRLEPAVIALQNMFTLSP